MARCVFCRGTNAVHRQPAYSNGGKLIKHSRVFTIHVCEADRDVAAQSFDIPFTDVQMIGLYKETLGD